MSYKPANFTTTLPAWSYARWDGKTLLNRDQAPLWSGKGEPPAVGAYVRIAGPKHELATVLGYNVDGDWLMLWAHAHDRNIEGDLAGIELGEEA